MPSNKEEILGQCLLWICMARPLWGLGASGRVPGAGGWRQMRLPRKTLGRKHPHGVRPRSRRTPSLERDSPSDSPPRDSPIRTDWAGTRVGVRPRDQPPRRTRPPVRPLRRRALDRPASHVPKSTPISEHIGDTFPRKRDGETTKVTGLRRLYRARRGTRTLQRFHYKLSICRAFAVDTGDSF